MFGTRDEFRYVQCGTCDALQLQNPPVDWSRYYRNDYYAQGVAPRRTGIRRLLRLMRNRGTFLRNADLLSSALAGKMSYPIHGAREWFKTASINLDSPILDVGCGDGMIVQDLSEIGYRNVMGIDPFLAEERDVPGGGKIRRANVMELSSTFDVIMLHHSLEHAPSQVEMMSAVARRLSPNGLVIVRIPIVSSWAWQHYGTNWVQADAPRHYCLHSTRSLALLANKCGLRIERLEYDSTGFQIAGSELYVRDVPLTQLESEYTPEQRAEFDARAATLNDEKRGDQVACYLRHDMLAAPLA